MRFSSGIRRRGLLFLLVFFFFGAVSTVYTLDNFPGDSSSGGGFPASGDSAVAERYAQWIKDAMDRGQWSEALSALNRAADFSDVSSDISYLLALVRSHENKDRGSVLEALNKALYVDRWNLYDSEAARLLKADTLISIRAYQQALAELSLVRKSPREAVLTLKALMSRPGEFRRYMTDTLDRYPRESGPVRVFFNYLSNEDAAGRNPEREDLQLLELVLRRLPALLLGDAELAWMAAPFMRDSADARRVVSAYRAVNKPVPASLPIALKLGVIDEETALEELFTAGEASQAPALVGASADAAVSAGGESVLDITLLSDFWGLLRRDEARAIFKRNLSAYTGVIIEDADRDGIPETSAEYTGGLLNQYNYDADQDGIADLTVYFTAGDPRRALTLIPPDTSRDFFGVSGQTAVSSPRSTGSRAQADVQWEQYPAVQEVDLDGVRYIPRPVNFYYSPLKFTELWGSGVLFPQRDLLSPPLTRRVLVSQSLRVERPSLEFKGGTEVVELNQGIPVSAREYVGDRIVSETEFLRGRPLLQRVDLNLDGRMETVRHFRRSYRPAELEDLWNYDRDIDYTSTVEE